MIPRFAFMDGYEEIAFVSIFQQRGRYEGMDSLSIVLIVMVLVNRRPLKSMISKCAVLKFSQMSTP